QGTRTPEGHWRYWNYDGFAQDSWKLKSNFTLEFGVRAGLWTNNAELQKFGGYFDPSQYDPSKAQFLDPGTYKQVNGWRYTSLDPQSNSWPKTYSFSTSFARRIFFNQVVEAAYVGTRGRDLVSRRQLDAVPLGALLSGTVNGIDLSVPVNRVALDSSVINRFR